MVENGSLARSLVKIQLDEELKNVEQTAKNTEGQESLRNGRFETENGADDS